MELGCPKNVFSCWRDVPLDFPVWVLSYPHALLTPGKCFAFGRNLEEMPNLNKFNVYTVNGTTVVSIPAIEANFPCLGWISFDNYEELTTWLKLACRNGPATACRALPCFIRTTYTKTNLWPEKPETCPVCAGDLAMIRGRYPKEPNRKVCPTCLQETFDQIRGVVNIGETGVASALPKGV